MVRTQPVLWADEWRRADCPSVGLLQATHRLLAAALVEEAGPEQPGVRFLRFRALHTACALSLFNDLR